MASGSGACRRSGGHGGEVAAAAAAAAVQAGAGRVRAPPRTKDVTKSTWELVQSQLPVCSACRRLGCSAPGPGDGSSCRTSRDAQFCALQAWVRSSAGDQSRRPSRRRGCPAGPACRRLSNSQDASWCDRGKGGLLPGSSGAATTRLAAAA